MGARGTEWGKEPHSVSTLPQESLALSIGKSPFIPPQYHGKLTTILAMFYLKEMVLATQLLNCLNGGMPWAVKVFFWSNRAVPLVLAIYAAEKIGPVVLV